MTEPWEEWKTKGRFPTLPPAPWKSCQRREISTFQQLRRLLSLLTWSQLNRQESLTAGGGKVDIQNQDSHFPTAPKACGSKVKNLHSNLPGADTKNPALLPLTQQQIRLSETQTKGSRPPHGHHRPAHFRIILYWNQNRVSGSFFNWKMLLRPRWTCGLSPPSARSSGTAQLPS